MSNNEATIRIQRFNPDHDKKPYIEEFTLPIEGDPTLLDALQTIKTTVDGSVTFRRSCRHAICGSCAMNVNGRNILVCHEPLKKHLDSRSRVTIRPLPYLPIIKDLVVDRSSFWKQYQLVKPWLVLIVGVTFLDIGKVSLFWDFITKKLEQTRY